MDFAPLDQAIADLSDHKDECAAEIVNKRVASSITDEYNRALGHEEEHLTQLLVVLTEQRALMVQIQTKINEITAYLANVDALKLKVGGVPGNL